MLFAIDVETACTVEGCPHHGRSMCAEGHSLSPWHSRITVAAVVSEKVRRVFHTADGSSIAAALSDFLERMDGDYEIVMHNGKFDWLHLARHGFEIPMDRWVGDSQVAAYVLTEKIPDRWLAAYEDQRTVKGNHHRKAGKHSLKTLAPYHLDVEAFWEPEHDHDDDEYVLKDAAYTLELTKVLEAKLKEHDQYTFYKERMLPWTKMLLAAEWRGIELDMDGLAAKEQEIKAKAEELKQKLDVVWYPAHAAYSNILVDQVHARYNAMKPMKGREERRDKALAKIPWGISYDSPAQMTWLLRDYLGYDITSLEGKESTGREVLERLAEEGKEDVKTYLEWRKANKILTAFLPTYSALAVNGTLHPIYNPTTTRTGRTSSERPNCQQVPPQLRPLFKARKGYKLVGYDAGAIEAKLIALYSEDETLYSIIKDGVSLHDFNTVNFFEMADAEIPLVKTKYPQHRKASKNVGFALFYNAGPNRIRIAMAQAGFIITLHQAKQMHKRFKARFTEAYEYGMEVVRHFEEGNVLTNLLGRPLKIEHAEDAYMQGLNTLIQSSASDLNLHGAHLAYEEFKRLGIDATPLLFVHDFVCFEVRDEHVAEADEILKYSLTNFDLQTKNGPIVLTVDGGVATEWSK